MHDCTECSLVLPLDDLAMMKIVNDFASVNFGRARYSVEFVVAKHHFEERFVFGLWKVILEVEPGNDLLWWDLD